MQRSFIDRFGEGRKVLFCLFGNCLGVFFFGKEMMIVATGNYLNIRDKGNAKAKLYAVKWSLI